MDVEKVKILNDHTRHISTMSTAALLLLATFHEKLPGFNRFNYFLAISLIVFTLSLICALMAQKIVISTLANTDYHREEDTLVTVDNALIWSWIFFVLGMVVLCVIGVFGFYFSP